MTSNLSPLPSLNFVVPQSPNRLPSASLIHLRLAFLGFRIDSANPSPKLLAMVWPRHDSSSAIARFGSLGMKLSTWGNWTAVLSLFLFCLLFEILSVYIHPLAISLTEISHRRIAQIVSFLSAEVRYHRSQSPNQLKRQSHTGRWLMAYDTSANPSIFDQSLYSIDFKLLVTISTSTVFYSFVYFTYTSLHVWDYVQLCT